MPAIGDISEDFVLDVFNSDALTDFSMFTFLIRSDLSPVRLIPWLYYLKLAQVLRPGGQASEILVSQEEVAVSLSSCYADFNSLKDFVSAFPISPQCNSLKRTRSPLSGLFFLYVL